MASCLTIMAATSSSQSSCQPHHHQVARKCKRSGAREFRLENTLGISRVRNPVCFSGKVTVRGRRRRVCVSAVSHLDRVKWSTKCVLDRQENGTGHLPFPSKVAAKLEKVGPRHGQIPWSWSASLHLPLALPNVALWLYDVSRSKLHVQQPSDLKDLKSEALREPNTKTPVVCCSSDAPPADGCGLRIGVVSRKFCEGLGESAFWREWSSKPCQKIAKSKHVVLRKGFRDASCMFKASKKLSVTIWCDLAGAEWILE